MSSSESLVDYLGLKMGKLDHPDLKYLWVGSKADASNLEALVANNIHFVVNCTPDHLEGGVKNFHETQRGFRYFRVPIRDVKSEVIHISYLRDAWRFMKRAKDVGVNCLVHCSMGISRSSTVLTSFIMHTTGVGYDEALKIVKDARSCAEPNAGFADQLRYFHLSGDMKSDI